MPALASLSGSTLPSSSSILMKTVSWDSRDLNSVSQSKLCFAAWWRYLHSDSLLESWFDIVVLPTFSLWSCLLPLPLCMFLICSILSCGWKKTLFMQYFPKMGSVVWGNGVPSFRNIYLQLYLRVIFSFYRSNFRVAPVPTFCWVK